MERYFFSDLAFENFGINERKNMDFAEACTSGFVEYEQNGVKVCKVIVDTEEKACRYKCRMGAYVTVFCDKISELSVTAYESLSNELAALISERIENKLSKSLDYKTRVLVVGLGNPNMATDSIGPMTADRIDVTGHILRMSEEIFRSIGKCQVFAISAGVSGSTGMSSASIVKGVATQCLPDLIIAVDSLASRDVSRLASTVQITDNGISPGSGINNSQAEISERALGIPVIAIGIPTVINSATLVGDALKRAGIKALSDDMRSVLDEGRRFFVAPKECDIISKSAASLLASAINKAISVKSYNKG